MINIFYPVGRRPDGAGTVVIFLMSDRYFPLATWVIILILAIGFKTDKNHFILVPLLVNFVIGKTLEKIREIILYKTHFNEFFQKQSEKVKSKIDYVLYVVSIADQIPKKFFDHLSVTDGLYEIRIEYSSNIYRIFCCFDDGNIVVLFNGFQKKTQKTPKEEIEKALKIKNEYFDEKVKNKRYEK
jgi:phage-related protein